jgi:anti-sigma-K factor RskA
VIPFRPRRRAWTLVPAFAAAAAAVVAVGLGFWALSLQGRLDDERALREVLSDPQAQALQLTGADGKLYVDSEGRAVLVVDDLGKAPSGKDYELWVIEDDVPRPAGLFEGGDARDVVRLDETVPEGATVAATLERDGGVDSPEGDVLFTATA